MAFTWIALQAPCSHSPALDLSRIFRLAPTKNTGHVPALRCAERLPRPRVRFDGPARCSCPRVTVLADLRVQRSCCVGEPLRATESDARSNAARRQLDSRSHAGIDSLFQEDGYTSPVRIEILQLVDLLGLIASDSTSFAVLRQISDRLVTRHRATANHPASTEVADGRGGWIGWVDLVKERVDELAMTHTAKVIEDVDADIIAVVEAESRIALKHFTDAGVDTDQGGPAYPHVMVIDGNDDRGIDVGLMTKPTHSILTAPRTRGSYQQVCHANGGRLSSRLNGGALTG
jgi:hypothetical protein